MLNTYLNAEPFTKFVLIKDSLAERGTPLLNYIARNHIRLRKHDIHYFVYEGLYKSATERFLDGDVKFHDCVTNLHGWKNRISKETLNQAKRGLICICPCPDYKEKLFSQFCSEVHTKSVVVIDSLAHLTYDYDFKCAYELLSKLKSNPNIVQIVCVLHQDLLDDPKMVDCYNYLASLELSLEAHRVMYSYKKPSGKVVKQIEEYKFVNGQFITEGLKKIDAAALIERSLEIQPDSLTTFKISLETEEKESRENLVLPYLPKLDKSAENEPQIIYQLDDQDDWDEEDPDDDLDF